MAGMRNLRVGPHIARPRWLALKALAGALVVVGVVPEAALAWSGQGHHIAAEIAEQYLEPEATRQVRELLAIENAATLVQVSTWADDIRGERPDTAAWHYVNIPIRPAYGPLRYDAARDCPDGNCAVAKIDALTVVLSDKAAPPRERLEALKFLVHLVADVHQPLYCADNDDRRGSDIHVSFLGSSTTLHALWDSGFLEAATIGDEREYAVKLAQSIKPADLDRWQKGTPADWATESYRIARLIYGGSHEARALQVFYETDFLPVIKAQLEKAGVRLANLLNATLK